MEVNNIALIHNRFDIVVRDKKSLEVLQEATGFNTILNNFWTNYMVGNRGACFGYIHYGSGDGVTVVSQTSLQTPISRKAGVSVTYDYSRLETENLAMRRSQIRLEAGDHVGATICEVGLGLDNATGLCTRSLIADMNGNPIAIVKTDTMVVDIYSTFFFAIPESPLGGKLTLKGGSLRGGETEDNLFIKWVFGGALSGASYTKTGIPVAAFKKGFMGRPNEVAQKTLLSNPSVTYDAPNKKVTFSIPNFTTSQGNIGGISGIEMMSGLYMELPNASITAPTITKEVIGTGDGTNKDFSPVFKSIQDSPINKAYVNDVEVPATIDAHYRHPSGASAYANFGGMFLATEMISPTGETVYENPFYAECGVTGMNQANGWKFYASQNGTDWTLAVTTDPTGYKEYSVPSGLQKYRYWYASKFQASTLLYGITSAEYNSLYGSARNVVHLDSAPAAGATVSLTYLPNCIPKDANSVFNGISVSLTFAEYTP